MIVQPDDDAWEAWHPADLGNLLSGISRLWCIVGGWALDLWHGRQTRDHDDLEFTILRGDLDVFRAALHGLDFYSVGSGIVTLLPDNADPAADIAQIWCLDRAAGRWRVDMMIEPGTPQTWVYKRDSSIFGPRHDFVRPNRDGLPYLAPAAVLLFKAKYQRAKDEADFENALPRLPAVEREWLKTCLRMVHPGHDWISAL